MLMTDELFWRWSYILYLSLCLYLCAYESELNNSKCHFLWIMDVPELPYTKDSNINICNFRYRALCRSRRLSEMFSSLMEWRDTYLRIAESWYLAKLRNCATSTNYLPHSYWHWLGPLFLTFAGNVWRLECYHTNWIISGPVTWILLHHDAAKASPFALHTFPTSTCYYTACIEWSKGLHLQYLGHSGSIWLY
jgi:hypothetical protein